MKVYTKTGDEGKTSLWNGKRVEKNDLRIKTIGSIDELTSYIGLVKSLVKEKNIKIELQTIQQELMLIMAEIAEYKGSKKLITDKEVYKLESCIDGYQAKVPKQNKFVLPGNNKISATLDVSRTIARRCERKIVDIISKNKDKSLSFKYLIKYMNRLSDYLFTLARYIDFIELIKQKVNDVVPMNESSIEKTNMTLNLAKKIIEKIEQKAGEIKLPVVISVTNSSGNIIAVHVMDNALIASYDISVNKAYTAVSVKISTKQLAELSQPGQSLYGIQWTNNNRIVNFGGGVPLKINGYIIGGIGVSGGTANQDTMLADYGKEVFEDIIGRSNCETT